MRQATLWKDLEDAEDMAEEAMEEEEDLEGYLGEDLEEGRAQGDQEGLAQLGSVLPVRV